MRRPSRQDLLMKYLALTPLVIAATITAGTAVAQTYSHEFVLEDGSAITCQVSLTGSYSTSTSCNRVSREARLKAMKSYSESLGRLNVCADLALESAKANPHIYDYSGSVLSACLGRDSYSSRRPAEPGMAFEINCKGELTNKPVSILAKSRTLSECPGLVELALSGQVPYRTDQAR